MSGAGARHRFCSTLVFANRGAFALLGGEAGIQFWMVCAGRFCLSVLDSLEKPTSGRCTKVAGRKMDLLGGRLCGIANLGYRAG